MSVPVRAGPHKLRPWHTEQDRDEAMSDLTHLLADIIARPTDMAPRRAYADAVRATDHQRAELIDLQLAIRQARRAGTEPPNGQRARALAHGRGKEWAPKLAPLVTNLGYFGGFVERVEVTPTQLVMSAAALPQLAPIRYLALRDLHGHVGKIASLPILARLVSLDVSSCNLDDAEIAALVASPHLANLVVFWVNNNPIGADALRAIGRASLPALRYVETAQTDAELVRRYEEDGRITHLEPTTLGATLGAELGPRPWLVAQDPPSLDAL